MFPIRKRKTTYGTFSSPAKVPRTEIMPGLYHRRTKRRTPYYRKKRVAQRGNSGRFFSPSSTQPPIKKRPWEWVQCKVDLQPNTGTFTDITVANVITALLVQLSYNPSSIKVSSIQIWNSAGIGAAETYPTVELKPISQLNLSTPLSLGRFDDTGNINEPARVGYKWSNTESQVVYEGNAATSLSTLAQYKTGNGVNCYAHVMVSYLA